MNQTAFDLESNKETQKQEKPVSKDTVSPKIPEPLSTPDRTKAKFLFSIGKRGTQVEEFHGVFGLGSDHVNKRIIATDCHNNRIQVFDEEGNFLFCFGRKGFNDGEFQSPTGVGVGPNGEMVICERLKGRIQVSSQNSGFRKFMIFSYTFHQNGQNSEQNFIILVLKIMFYIIVIKDKCTWPTFYLKRLYTWLGYTPFS